MISDLNFFISYSGYFYKLLNRLWKEKLEKELFL